MRYGKTVHVSTLRIGDVVRPVRGPSHPKPSKAGDVDDFREGYDAMTVVAQDEQFLTFHRPHVEVYDDQQRNNHVAVSVEIVNMVSRAHKGLYYELLSYGPHPDNNDPATGRQLSHWEGKWLR